MSNEVVTRITLEGSQQDVKRFNKLCIKPDADEPDGFFDFETLVPTPADLPSDQSNDWAMENWGCKWNSHGLREHWFMGHGIDYSFCTPNTMPVGVLQALAKQFPAFEGDVESGSPNGGWAVRGVIKNGGFEITWEGELDDEIAESLGLISED